MQLLLVFLTTFCIFCNCFCCHGFVQQQQQQQHQRSRRVVSSYPPSSSTTTILRVIPSEIAVDVAADVARTQFFLWFFGSSGGVGVALSAFPRMYGATQYIQSLKGSPSLGGDNIGLSPLCGYPEDLTSKDVEQIINNKLTVSQLVEKFPIEGNFLSSKGYLTFQAFEQANSGGNPLAIRAIFDSFSQSQDTCEPYVAQDKLDSYKEDISLLKSTLLTSKLVGYSSIATLLFLLGLAETVALTSAKDGWFPSWNLEDGILNIPNYWI
ncbi:MAG: hypothetical protein ACI8RD_004291 [Bacillariaceae sp.]|jgi:hypothetical protein